MTDREAVEQLRQRAWTGQTPGLERIRRLLDRLGIRRRDWRGKQGI